MVPVNLLKMYHTFNSMNISINNRYLMDASIARNDMKSHEIKGICQLVELIDRSDYSLYEGFYIGFSIQRLGKEFDLIQIGEEFIINIELKSSLDISKAKKQLLLNRYYLTSLKKEMYLFTFDSKNNELYQLMDGKLKKVNIDILRQLLRQQENIYKGNIHDLFEVSQFLVSPFNKTQEFLNNQYFLTTQQYKIKKDILNIIKRSTKEEILMIQGDPGTGKTLLCYDIIKDIQHPFIIHCGLLNDGHKKLIESGYHIIEIKNYKQMIQEQPSVIFVDEAQRIYQEELDDLIHYVKEHKAKLILSCDFTQNFDMDKLVEPSIFLDYLTYDIFKLSGKIRSNMSMHFFIERLLDLCKTSKKGMLFKDIEIGYMEDEKDAFDYISYLQNQGYVFINYSSDILKNPLDKLTHLNCHKVLGQEYDKVCICMNQQFYYENSRLKCHHNSSSYDGIKMLYQMLTRATSKINLVIVSNKEVFEKCLMIKENR